MRRARPAELNFTRIFTWPQYFIGHLMPGHVLPCPSVARRPPMNQSAAFKDFFLKPGIRNPPYLAWNILRAISRLFLSFPPILSFFSHRFSISSLPFNAGDGLFVVGNALRERERERGEWFSFFDEGKKGSHLKLETRRKRSGCYVVACDSRVDPGTDCTRACVGRCVSHGGNFCSRVVGDLFERCIFRSIRNWVNLTK